MSFEPEYDEAMFAFSQGDFDGAIARFEHILSQDTAHFDALLSLGMACYRKGEYARAIEKGHQAERLKPNEQLVHTNLSLFYMKAGDKTKAEHHGLQARIASWKTSSDPNLPPSEPAEPELSLGAPPPAPVRLPSMPWKKKKPIATSPPEGPAEPASEPAAKIEPKALG